MNLRDLLSEAGTLLRQHPEWMPRPPRNPLKIFETGGGWTQAVLGDLRGKSMPAAVVPWTRFGYIKYLSASFIALIFFAAGFALRLPWLALAAVPAFYLVEVQMLFLFPLASDGSSAPFRESRIWTRKAGGTWRVLPRVCGIALVMVFGGLRGGRYIQHWTLGCLAVLLWYERLRAGEAHGA